MNVLARLLYAPLAVAVRAYRTADGARDPWDRPDPLAWIDERIRTAREPGHRKAWQAIRDGHHIDHQPHPTRSTR
ncbi:MAG: hypothetical protein HOV68_23705 [Streptomycetaceae bacterium]|nr:hypothetical protein [Streptomycetaceae bacterium]